MYICNYCGTILKKEYEICPNCGGSSFENKSDLGEIIIREPPKDGFKVNLNNMNQHLNKAIKIKRWGVFLLFLPIIVIAIMAVLFLILISLYAIITQTADGEIHTTESFFSYALGFIFFTPLSLSIMGAIVGLVLFIIGIASKKACKKEIERIKALSIKGMLIKNIPYTVSNDCMRIVFKNSAGVEIPLYSESKFDIRKMMDIDKTADLLIDPDDYANYYIDYEII